MDQDIPLFPLNSVLFPGSYLPLRIFEQRYLTMVRDCARNDSGFGVCLIQEGQEAGKPASPYSVGTLAHITDWYTLDDGLLGVTTRGGRRFHATAIRVDGQGLIHASAQWLEDPGPNLLPPEFSLLAKMLERILEQMSPSFPGYSPDLLDDDLWVSYRLTDLLPLDPKVKQQLLEMSDPTQRLQQLLELIPAFIDG